MLSTEQILTKAGRTLSRSIGCNSGTQSTINKVQSTMDRAYGLSETERRTEALYILRKVNTLHADQAAVIIARYFNFSAGVHELYKTRRMYNSDVFNYACERAILRKQITTQQFCAAHNYDPAKIKYVINAIIEELKKLEHDAVIALCDIFATFEK